MKLNDIELIEVSMDPSFFEVPTLLFDIYVKSIDAIVGRVEYRFEEKQDLMYYGNIGYVIHRAYRGNSYAYYGTLALIAYLKETYPEITEVYITCNPDNIPSKKTIEKLGVHYLGRVDIDKKHELYRIGDKQKDIYIKFIEVR